MHQIKIFKGLESDLSRLEQEMNQWLRESKVRVLQMFGNIAPQSQSSREAKGSIAASPYVSSDVLMVVLYEAL